MVRRLALQPFEGDALDAEVKDTVRWAMTAENSRVLGGSFAGLNLESGRVRRRHELAELRARCQFPSGSVRVVTVAPAFKKGDLYWVRAGRGSTRATSKWTLEVLDIEAGRLQDMIEKEALREGVALIPEKLRATGTPRDWFQRTRPLAWQANPWVWVVRMRRHRLNVDQLLKVWRSCPP